MEQRQTADKNRWVIIVGLAGLISAADNWMVAPILPAIAAGLHITISLAGLIFTAYMIPYGVMQPGYGFMSDRWGKTRVLQIIVAGLALGTAGCASASSLWILCCWRALTGFFAAGIIAVSLALIGDHFPAEERQQQVGHFMGMVFLGQGISVGLGGILANYISWRISFALLAILAGVICGLLGMVPKTAGLVERRHFIKETIRVLCLPKGRIIFPLAFVTGFLLLGGYSYLGIFLHEVLHLNYTEIGLIVMFYGLACLLTGRYVGKISGRWGEKGTLISGSGIALLAVVQLAISTHWYEGWIATVGLGMGYILIQSTLATKAFEVDPNAKGLPSALVGLGLFGGGGLGSAFLGVILPWGGYLLVWGLIGGGLLALVAMMCLMKME